MGGGGGPLLVVAPGWGVRFGGREEERWKRCDVVVVLILSCSI